MTGLKRFCVYFPVNQNLFVNQVSFCFIEKTFATYDELVVYGFFHGAIDQSDVFAQERNYINGSRKFR